MWRMADTLAGIAAIITSLGSFIAALVAARKAWAASSQLEHNHGGSVKDAVSRIEAQVDRTSEQVRWTSEQVKSLGHQVGEIRRDSAVSREGVNTALESLDDRMRRFEKRL